MCSRNRCTEELYLQTDYDLQATLVETVLRLLGTTEKEMFASRWFAVESVKSAFLSIKNQDFENVCKTLSEIDSHPFCSVLDLCTAFLVFLMSGQDRVVKFSLYHAEFI